jgi:hypothetical protein
MLIFAFASFDKNNQIKKFKKTKMMSFIFKLIRL